MSDILQSALRYAAAGLRVFPCSPATDGTGKRPLVSGESAPGAKDGGLYLATTDEDQIRAWWRRWPRALIGLPTGAVNGVVVIDLDPRAHPADAMLAALADWCGDLDTVLADGEIVAPPVVVTQSGGLHLYFAHPGVDVGNRANLFGRLADVPEAIAAHVDVRGDGGYVIAPPSVMASGKIYSGEIIGVMFPHLPRRLEDLILRRGAFQPGGGARPASSPALVDPDASVRKYALAALDAEAMRVRCAPAGARSATINEAAFAVGQLVGAAALSPAVAEAALVDAARALGLPDGDKAFGPRGTIARGLRDGAASPRDLSDVRRRAETRNPRGGARLPEPPPHPGLGADDGDPSPPLAPDHDDHDGEAPSQDDGPAADMAVVEACAAFDHSDTDNARRLRAHFGADLVVLSQDEVAGGAWLGWCGTHWDLASGAALALMTAQRLGALIGLEAAFIVPTAAQQKALDDYAALPVRYVRPDDAPMEHRALVKEALGIIDRIDRRRAARRNHAVTSKNHARMVKALDCLAPHMRRPPDDFNLAPLLVATRTHTLEFLREPDPECPDPTATRHIVRLVEHKAHRREDYITACVPHSWRGLDAPAPKWRAFMAEMLPDAERRRTVQQFTGLGLTGVIDQHLMFHYGLGANGKSVFLETICRVLGEGLTVGLPRESVVGSGERGVGAASPDLVRLYGKRLVRILEVKGDAPLQEDLVKKLTGGERFPVRTLFKGFFEFRNIAKAHMSGNGLPTISGADLGIWRRMLVVHWDVTVPAEKRRDFEEMVSEFIREEASGILAWLVEGVLDYLANGLVIAPDVARQTDQYRQEMDPIGEFIGACLAAAPGERVGASEAYTAYEAWSAANAKRARSQTKFGRDLSQRFEKICQAGRNYYVDCRLHDVPAAPRGEARNLDEDF